jgi:hypothetical protein
MAGLTAWLGFLLFGRKRAQQREKAQIAVWRPHFLIHSNPFVSILVILLQG